MARVIEDLLIGMLADLLLRAAFRFYEWITTPPFYPWCW